MLFVSRIDIPDKVWVYDTERDREKCYKRFKLVKLHNRGVEIKGVEPIVSHLPQGDKKLFVNCTPYQYEEYQESWQTKLHVLKGVEATMFKGCLTGLYWNCKNRRPTIKLSDYCKVLESGVFLSLSRMMNMSHICFEFDDSLEVRKHALDGMFIYNVTVDISKVTRQDLVETIYAEYIDSECEYMDEPSVIDSIERFRFWESCRYIENDMVNWNKRNSMPPLTDDVVLALYDRYMPKFEYLFRDLCPIYRRRKGSIMDYLGKLKDNLDFWQSNPQDFDEVYAMSSDIITYVGSVVVVPDKVCSILVCFLRVLPVRPDLREGYVKFVNRVHRKLIKYGMRHGLLKV